MEDLARVSSSNFSFSTRVRCDSILNNTCPHVTIVILSEYDMSFVPLTIKGCVGHVNVKMGDAIKSGRNSDLSSFGVDIYQWQELDISVEDKDASLYLNGALVMELPFHSDMGRIAGFNLNFTGSGAVDYVRLADGEGRMVYESDF